MPVLPPQHQTVMIGDPFDFRTVRVVQATTHEMSESGLVAREASSKFLSQPSRRMRLVGDLEQGGLRFERSPTSQSRYVGLVWGTALGLGVPAVMASIGSSAARASLAYLGGTECQSNIPAFLLGSVFLELALVPRLLAHANRHSSDASAPSCTMTAFCTGVFSSIIGGAVASGIQTGVALGSTSGICSAQALAANPFFPLLGTLLYRQYRQESVQRRGIVSSRG